MEKTDRNIRRNSDSYQYQDIYIFMSKWGNRQQISMDRDNVNNIINKLNNVI